MGVNPAKSLVAVVGSAGCSTTDCAVESIETNELHRRGETARGRERERERRAPARRARLDFVQLARGLRSTSPRLIRYSDHYWPTTHTPSALSSPAQLAAPPSLSTERQPNTNELQSTKASYRAKLELEQGTQAIDYSNGTGPRSTGRLERHSSISGYLLLAAVRYSG